jgi:hypothetical protein
MSASAQTDNVHPFGRAADIALWRAVADRLGLTGGPLEAFRTATDAGTADRAYDLMCQGPIVFDLGRPQLELPRATREQQAARRRLIATLRRAYQEELKRAKKLRRKAAAEAGRARDQVPGVNTPAQQFVDSYAYDEVAGTWVRRSSMERLNRAAVEHEWVEKLGDALVAEDENGGEHLRPLVGWFKEQAGAIVVERLCHTPLAASGAVVDAVIEGWSKRMLNAWRDPIPDVIAGIGWVTDRDVQLWLDLVCYVLTVKHHDDPRAEPVLDWLSGLVAAPAVKPGWSLYLSGDPGAGKNLLILPLELAFGPGGAHRITPERLRDKFDEYLKARLCILSEARETTPGTITPHDAYSRIKEIVDATAGWRLIDPKFEKKEWAYSTTGLAMFSNEQNMLPVDARERRLGYYRVEVEPRPRADFEYLVAWLKENVFDPFGDMPHAGTPGWKLVVKWLVQRWAGLDEPRRAAFQGDAPMTPEKAVMVSVAANPAKELLGAAIAGDFGDGKIPDLIDILGVRQRLQGMIDNGGFGVDKGTRIPANAKLGDWLREFKAERLNYDPIKRVHTQILCGNTRRRLWAVRNAEKYRALLPNEIAAMWGFLNRGI